MKLLPLLLEAARRIPKIRVNGTFYHGTYIDTDSDDDKIIRSFSPTHYSDWDATWFSSDENVADEFGEDKVYDPKTSLQATYRVHLQSKAIADIDYELGQILKRYHEFDDFRDMIDILRAKGYDGWKTPGSIGSTLYDDWAIFNKDCITIEAVKLKLNGVWTAYLPLDEAEALLDEAGDEEDYL